MSTNPYKKPDSNLETHEELPSRPVRGIILGLVIDLGGTIVLVIISTIIYSFVLVSGGASQGEIESLTKGFEPTSTFGMINIILGLFMSFIGGMYCAKIARSKNYLYPGIMASISFVISIVSAWGTVANYLLMILSTTTVVAVLLGARMHLRQK